MVASTFLDYITKYQLTTYVGVEDFADRFNFLYSVCVFLLCTTIVSLKQYLLKAISCYLPNSPGGTNLLDYVENFCWVEGTLPFHESDALPQTDEEWKSVDYRRIRYYQWIPFVLGLQCIMFTIPRFGWQLFCYNSSGTDLQHLIITANEAVHSDTETRKKMVDHLKDILEQLFLQHREYRTGQLAKFRRRLHSFVLCIGGKRLGSWYVMKYIVLKFVYLSNAMLQLALMHHYLQFNDKYLLFGYEIATNILSGRDWLSTLVFPRVAYCPVRIKQHGANNGVSAQCVLPANMLNEKIYIFLWYWVLLVLCITVVSIPVWFYRVFSELGHLSFVNKFLRLGIGVDCSMEHFMIRRFIEKFLRHDGVFILRMVALNAGDIIASDITCSLWKTFKDKYSSRDFGTASDDEDSDTKKNNVVKLEKAYSMKRHGNAFRRNAKAPSHENVVVANNRDLV